MTLYCCKKSKDCVIEGLPPLALLKNLGLRKGMKVRLMTKQPFGGPVIIQVGTRSIAIAREIAQQIMVNGG